MIDPELNKQLKNTINFITELLSEETDSIIDESESEEINSITFKNTISNNSFHEFEINRNSFKIAAVDGGSQRILNGGSFIVGGYRAGALLFQEQQPLTMEPQPSVKVQSISHGNRKDLYATVFQDLIGEQPNEYPHELMLVLQRLRTFEEWSVAQKQIEQLGKGDIILMDGSLKASIHKQDILFQRIMGTALENGIHFIGISKRSTLRFNHAPLIRFVKTKGEELFGKNKTWYCEIPDESKHSQLFGKRYIVKYHPSSRFVFRTDINRFDDVEPAKLFGKIAQYCSDATYLGYPYPLAHIHNQVVINRPLIEDISYRLEAIALENGIPNYYWDDLFQNFHDILDRNL